jgi:hypothetical protein
VTGFAHAQHASVSLLLLYPKTKHRVMTGRFEAAAGRAIVKNRVCLLRLTVVRVSQSDLSQWNSFDELLGCCSVRG